jgi:cardiolipin synthase
VFLGAFSQEIKECVEIGLIFDFVGSFSFRGKMIKKFKTIGVKAYP